MTLFQATALATNDKSLARNGKLPLTINAYLLAVSPQSSAAMDFMLRFCFRFLFPPRNNENAPAGMVAFERIERLATMPTLSSNPDRDLSADDASKKLGFGDWKSEHVPTLEELFEDPDIRKRIGRLIAEQAHPII